ncbi:hypothetical protein Salat_3000800, partial [Sesamum alatum]
VLGENWGFSYSALSFSLPDSSPKIGKQQLPSRNWSFTRCPSAPLWGSKNRALHPRTGRVLYSPSFAFHPPFALSGDWIGFVFRRDPAHARKASASGLLKEAPELSRQESSETETSGTDYTDATRTDDPYRGSTSHGKNRRLMRALLQGAKPVTADADGTEWRVGTNRKARERFSTSILAETGKIKGMNIQIVNSPPSPKLRRKGAEYRWVA